MYVLTEKGKEKAQSYIRELETKRKEILDAGKDTADDTNLPTVADIEADINWDENVETEGEYYNGWGVTDHFDSDVPLCLLFMDDFIVKEIA